MMASEFEESPDDSHSFDRCYFSISLGLHPSLTPLKVLTSSICLQVPRLHFYWIWSADLKSFEVLFNLSELCHEIPHLFSDLVLHNVINHCDLARQKAHHYLLQVKDVELSSLPDFKYYHFGNPFAFFQGRRPIGLKSVISILISRICDVLQYFCTSPRPSYRHLFSLIHSLLELCDNIILMCHCYFTFIHPLWSQSESNSSDFDFNLFDVASQYVKHILIRDQFLASRLFYTALYEPQ